MKKLLPYLQIILCVMCEVTRDDYANHGVSAWTTRWKEISHRGGKVRKNKFIDYGNYEYSALVWLLCKYDNYCAECIRFLAFYWPSLDPFNKTHVSDHGFSMKGDVIEIFLAALEGEELFKARLLEQFTRTNETWIPTSELLNALCRLVHEIDAYLRTGKVKYNDQSVYQLYALPRFKEDRFVQMWRGERESHGICLAALFHASQVPDKGLQ
jgi:hypothetical protein